VSVGKKWKNCKSILLTTKDLLNLSDRGGAAACSPTKGGKGIVKSLGKENGMIGVRVLLLYDQQTAPNGLKTLKTSVCVPQKASPTSRDRSAMPSYPNC